MARIRTIKPEFWTSEQVVECSPIARLLFIGMWNFCDDAGNHPASFKTLKMEVFPGDEISLAQIESYTEELLRNGLLIRYDGGNGREYWHVTGWHHQKVDRPNPKHPPFNSSKKQKFDEHSTNDRGMFDDQSPPEGKGKEGNVKEGIYDERERVTNPTLCVPENEKTGADAPRSQTQKPPDKFSQTHVPQDFEPERAGIGLAGQHGLDVNKEVERFVAHYTANGALRANWQAQFRKWLLQAAQLKADALKRSRSPPNGSGGKQQLMMEAGKSLFAHRDEEKGHEREIEGTAEFVECDTDRPVAGIVDKQDL